MTFEIIKTDYLDVLNDLSSHILYPQDRLDAIKNAAFAEFAISAEKYNKQVLKARKLVTQLQDLKKFGWFYNSQRAWLASIIKCATFINYYISEATNMLKVTGFDAFRLRQSGITNINILIFLAKKKNNLYVITTDNESKELTYVEICKCLPRPMIMSDKVLGIDNSVLNLDPSDQYN